VRSYRLMSSIAPGDGTAGVISLDWFVKTPYGANMCVTKTREVFHVETERVMLHR
jgi:hypothetical protein